MKKKKWAAVFLVGFLFIGLVLYGYGREDHTEERKILPGKTMVVSFITIGKGDAFLMKMPEGGYYMYDTGKKEDWEQIEKVLKQKKVSSLKGIFLSHGHKDHAGNVKRLLRAMPVENVYISARDQASYGKIDVRSIVEESDSNLQLLYGGEQLNLEGVMAEVWIPERCDYQNSNNNSMVVRFSYGENACLMTGDMENEEEAAFLQSGVTCRADLLKLGHHGERDATSVALLKKVKPLYGLITGNKEENPASVDPEIRARLESYGIEPFYSEGNQIAWDFLFDGRLITVSKYMEKKGE
jgi:competence protein ComEC